MIADTDLFATCIWTEANGQPYEGKVAVARVIYNRMAARYGSDGTIAGTVLRYDQFSAFYFAFERGRYSRICDTEEEAAAQAQRLLATARASALWDDCVRAIGDGRVGSGFAWGPEGQKIDGEPRTLLYANLDISQPYWASPECLVAKVYAHSFFRD